MYKFAFYNFIRSRSVWAALVLFFVAGIISIFIGRQFLLKQEAAIQSVTQSQQEHIERNVKYIKDEFGLLMYYLKFAYIHKPAPIAALAIGQQDINTNIQSLTIRGLEAQRYDTDLYNPYNLMTGNFDLSFVITCLFPLLIIAFNFNVLSGEKEGGTWPLVKVQSQQPLRFLFQKLSIRLIVVCALLFSLLALAKMIIGIPLDAAFAAYSIMAFLYILVWFAISFLIIALHKNTNINALLLLGVWVLLCLLVPALINNYVTAKYAVPEAYSTFIKQRDGYHTKWDKDKDSTVQTFFHYYPEYKNYTWNKPSFNYVWFYAMQHLGDEEAREESMAMHRKLQERSKVSTIAGLFFPATHAQLQFTNIAHTGMQQHLQYLDSTGRFHENLRRYFYPKIFGDSAVESEQWKKHVPVYFRAEPKIEWMELTLPLLFTGIMLFGAGVLLYIKNGWSPRPPAIS
jgi:ABC-2 type transport system permease protein